MIVIIGRSRRCFGEGVLRNRILFALDHIYVDVKSKVTKPEETA